MTSSLPSARSSDLVIQTLAWCRRQNFRPIPLQHQSKAAIHRDFAKPSYAPSDSLWQDARLDIGVLLGPSAGGPVDIDLDCDEAIWFAPRFLPPTPAIFGRKSKPSSHYLYRVETDALDKKAILDPVLKNTIIEMRADGGHQTVLPGSLHQDTGELIEWTSVPFPDPARVDAKVLREAVAMTALAVLASRHLWHDGQRNEMVKHLAGLFYYLERPQEEVLTLVQALDDYHDSHDKTHAMTIASTYKKAERGNKVVGAGSLRKLVGDLLVDRILDLLGSQMVNILQEYNERFCVVAIEGKFRIADTDVPPGEPPTFFQKDDFMNIMGTDYTTIDDKLVPKAKLWLTNPRRRAYRAVDFLPGMEDPLRILNLWTGWSTQPKPGSCEAWLTLLEKVICGGDSQAFRWMLNWFANILHEPRDRSMTAPVLIGRQGAGKSLLLAYFGRILGPAYTVITNEEHIYGRFNKHLATTLLLHSEEALYGGDIKHRGIIKSLITDEFRIFEPKGIDARQVRNYLRLVLTSNMPHAAPAEAGDRRFTVIDLQDRLIDDDLKRKVVAEMNGDGPAALFQFLLDYEYDPEVARTNIKNEALETLKGINQNHLEAWWLDTLMTGYILPDYLSWATRPAGMPWPEVVGSPALYASMSIRLRERGARNIPNETMFAAQIHKFIGMKLKRSQREFVNPMSEEVPQAARFLHDRQAAIINMPDLYSCRKAFEGYLGQEIEWPDEDEKPPADRY